MSTEQFGSLRECWMVGSGSGSFSPAPYVMSASRGRSRSPVVRQGLAVPSRFLDHDLPGTGGPHVIYARFTCCRAGHTEAELADNARLNTLRFNHCQLVF